MAKTASDENPHLSESYRKILRAENCQKYWRKRFHTQEEIFDTAGGFVDDGVRSCLYCPFCAKMEPIRYEDGQNCSIECPKHGKVIFLNEQITKALKNAREQAQQKSV